MIIVVMQKIKNRMMQLLRMLFVLSILIILIVQLVEAVKSVDIKENLQKGDSVRVELNVSASSDNREKEQSEDGWFDNLLNMLRNYHHGE